MGCADENHKKILKNFSPDLHGQTVGNVIYYDNEFNKFVIIPDCLKTESKVVVFAQAGLTGMTTEGLGQLAVQCLRQGIGMTGGKIVSHKGDVLYGRMEKGPDGKLHHADAGLPRGFTGYFHKSILSQNTEAVSEKLFAVRRELLEQWCPKEGQTSEELMLQLCEFVKASGYRIAYVPAATAAEKKEG